MYEPQSLPAWGAWIEMMSEFEQNRRQKESLPAWGAWIEIPVLSRPATPLAVAPRMGSVDRNSRSFLFCRLARCRSPHGERG